jgi:hypothetical protein
MDLRDREREIRSGSKKNCEENFTVRIDTTSTDEEIIPALSNYE